MKKNSFLVVLVIYFFLALILGSILWWRSQLRPMDELNKETTAFVVDKGEGVLEIAARLKQQDLIRNQFAFKILIVFSGIARKIKAGTYYLSPSMTAKEIAFSLTKGTNDRWLTIVEGLRAEQIGELFIRKGFAINPAEWEGEIKGKSLEGQLFPDSYLFPKGATQETILKIIQKNFQKKAVEGMKEDWAASNKDLKLILIMASMVEREAQAEEDRKIIVGILFKRLEAGWPLQVDATVQYAIASQRCSILKSPCDWWPHELTQKDLQIKSLYNTYLYRGLPPAPVCSPGLSSIKAALNPKDSAYWYYLSGSDGLMHYAKTQAEHTENIKKFLK